MAIGNFSGKPTGIAFSNRATPDRPEDYEVYPDAIDPLTNRSHTQGFRIEILGDSSDEQIMWLGVFEDRLYALTKTTLWRIAHHSQVTFGPNSVQKVASIGCLNGDTVKEVNGYLYWVAPGPTLMRWDGVSASGGEAIPETVSDDRIKQTLSDAPTAYWNLWFARYHATRDGHYYLLWMVPSGQTTATLRLDYNTSANVWEPNDWYSLAGTVLSWGIANVRFGGSNITDVAELFAGASNSVLYKMNTGDTDAGAAIRVRLATKDIDLEAVSLLKEWYLYLDAVADTMTLVVLCTESEYGEPSQSYSIDLAGSVQLEIRRRLHRHLHGRQVRFTLTGSVSHRPAFRGMRLRYLPIREQQITDA